MERAITMKATQMNPVVGDRMLDETGSEAVLLTDLGAETAQRIFVQLQFLKGEWPLDLDLGSPYYKDIFRKGTQDRVIRAVFGAIITSAEGVDRMLKFSYSITANRGLELTFSCLLKDGSVFRSQDYGPFIVNP